MGRSHSTEIPSSKLMVRVRFPSPAPLKGPCHQGLFHCTLRTAPSPAHGGAFPFRACPGLSSAVTGRPRVPTRRTGCHRHLPSFPLAVAAVGSRGCRRGRRIRLSMLAGSDIPGPRWAGMTSRTEWRSPVDPLETGRVCVDPLGSVARADSVESSSTEWGADCRSDRYEGSPGAAAPLCAGAASTWFAFAVDAVASCSRSNVPGHRGPENTVRPGRYGHRFGPIGPIGYDRAERESVRPAVF